MTLRIAPLCLILPVSLALAGDGILPRNTADDYPAHIVAGKIAIGAAYVTPAQARKLFGDDLDKHNYVVFEIGMFPTEQSDISADDFRLRQGKETSIVRAATPHMVAADIHPEKITQPKPPSKVNVQTQETIGYESGPYGHGVYTASRVDLGPPPARPAPQASSGNDQAGLEQQLEQKSLPETKTARAVAGYIFFPKPSTDKHADFELLYFGLDGQVSLKLAPKQ
jgi:hypothetical protein